MRIRETRNLVMVRVCIRASITGGYRDYFDDEQVAVIDALMQARAGPMFGYLPEAAPPQSAASDRAPGEGSL